MSASDVRKFTIQARNANLPPMTAFEKNAFPLCSTRASSSSFNVLSRRLDCRVSQLRTEGRRHIAEGRDAQVLRQSLELGVLLQQVEQLSRQAHVFGHRFHVAHAADLLQREPHFQRPEPTRVLRAVVHKIQRLSAEPVVRRMIREGIPQILRPLHERATCFERRVQPLVRIDRDRVCVRQAAEIRRCARNGGRKRSIGSVDVEPEILFAANRSDLG